MAAEPPIRARLACASLLVATTFIAASCGGAGSGSGTKTVAGGDTVINGTVTHRPMNDTGGSEANDDNPGNADSGESSKSAERSPCALVSKSEAQAILGKPIEAPQEAPLGPTCIYQPAGGASSASAVTLAIESVAPNMLKAQLHKQVRFDLAGHTGYCGVYGQTTTFVPLTDGGVLTVTAPCPVGRLFAAAALHNGTLR